MNLPDLIKNMLYEIFSLIRKFLHFLFPLHDNCICMSIIVSEIFPRKSSILLVILCNPKFYHIYVDENLQFYLKMSPPPFNCILIVFVCLSLYMNFHFQKIFTFKIFLMLSSILSYIC